MCDWTAAEVEAPRLLGYSVARLGLWMDARDAGVGLITPPCHRQFLTPARPAPCANQDDLVLRVANTPLPPLDPDLKRLCLTEVWELWQDDLGRFVFVAPRQTPPRRVVVNADFSSGKVLADFSANHMASAYPLQYLDIRLYANWLANYGDVLLHASGVAVDGQGYAFVGSSGAGKSTLAAALASDPAVTVLGEDQVALRYLEGCFWIYGTPWHEREQLCSPMGVPLKQLFILDREAPRVLTPLSASTGIARLLQTAFIPYYRPAAVSTVLDRLALLAERVPFHTLAYRLGSDVLSLIRSV